jgi:ribosomal protein L11 methyltransferase
MEKHSLTLTAGADGFGDGSHPTTAGVLAALESIDPTLFHPRIACDIGCGSGILSFSIIRLFKCLVVAVDNSKQAIETTQQNALHNGVEIINYAQNNIIEIVKKWRQETPLSGATIPLHTEGFSHPAIAAAAPFDLITMNILAAPLLTLATEAEQHLAPGGVLILSGIFLWQEPQIRAAYQSLNLELTSRLTLGDWVTLVWQKPGSD